MRASLFGFVSLLHRTTRLAGLSVLGLLAACAPQDPPVVRIGLLGVFSGPLAMSSGFPARHGAQLAVDEINAAGGVKIAGVLHRIVLVEREIADRPDAAAGGARALVNLDSIDVLIGPQTSTLAIAAAPVAEESALLMIAPMASHPSVTAGRRYVFRLAFLAPFQGEVLARFAYDSLRVRRVGVLRDAASPYGRMITEVFSRVFIELGGTLVGHETHDADGPRDFSGQLGRLLAARPEALLMSNFITPDSSQLQQARDLGFTGVFLGTDSWDVRGLTPNTAAQGAIVVANWDRETERPAARKFLEAWNARYSESPGAAAAATYDAIHLAAQALTRAGSRSGMAVADAMRATGRYEGAATDYDFRGGNDPVRGAVILEVRPTELAIRATIPPPAP